MSDKAKELASEIANLVQEFEDCSPELSGHLECVDNAGETNPIEWNLYLDEDDVKIVIDTGSHAFYIEHENLTQMLDASGFFQNLEPEQRKLLMAILEREE